MSIANQRISCADPSGNWDYYKLIGSKIKIMSMPISNFTKAEFKLAGRLTVANVIFRVSIDGKTITIIETEELPGKFFTLKDIQVLHLNPNFTHPAVCGVFCAGESTVGYLSPTEEYVDTTYVGY